MHTFIERRSLQQVIFKLLITNTPSHTLSFEMTENFSCISV